MEDHKAWGSGLWRFLHTTSFRYVPSQEAEYRKMLLALKQIIPCYTCRQSLILPKKDDYKSAHTLSYYFYNLHNKINIFLRKKVYKTYERVRKDYMYCIQPRFWGPGLWTFMHIVSINSDQESPQGLFSFFKSLRALIPCESCRLHYIENTKDMTVSTFSTPEKAGKYIYELHNKVNISIGKKPFKTFPAVVSLYQFKH